MSADQIEVTLIEKLDELDDQLLCDAIAADEYEAKFIAAHEAAAHSFREWQTRMLRA